jgi:multimeric flavodoxin WrbA
MQICLLNGAPDDHHPDFDWYLEDLRKHLSGNGHPARLLRLRELEARYCTGCWSCWVKTPGECVFKDDSHQVCQAFIQCDFVLFASPVVMGYLSAVMKKFMDKLIPLIHPYLTVDQGEAHHRHRYTPHQYPLGGLLLGKTPGTDQEDLEIITSIHERTMLNFKSRNAFTLLTDQPVQEVAHAILRN